MKKHEDKRKRKKIKNMIKHTRKSENAKNNANIIPDEEEQKVQNKTLVGKHKTQGQINQ